MLSAREPEWEPLLNFAPDHVGDFMWMYAVELTDGTRLQAYKHYWTRDYLHLDDGGRAFVFVGKERFEEVNPPWLLDRILHGETEQRYIVRQNVWPDEPVIRFAARRRSTESPESGPSTSSRGADSRSSSVVGAKNRTAPTSTYFFSVTTSWGSRSRC